MFSNGTPYFPQGQYLPQGLQYIPGPYSAYGASPYGPYGNSGFGGFGQEFGSPGFGQQVPVGGPQSIGPHLITTLSQLANQVALQGVAAQQVGVLLGQLVQQIVPVVVPAGLQGNPFIGTQAFNPLQRFGGQGMGTAFGQSPFGPQLQVPQNQNQAWAINRPGVLQ